MTEEELRKTKEDEEIKAWLIKSGVLTQEFENVQWVSIINLVREAVKRERERILEIIKRYMKWDVFLESTERCECNLCQAIREILEDAPAPEKEESRDAKK